MPYPGDIAQFETFTAALKDASITDDEVFRAVLSTGGELLRMNDDDLSEFLSVSRPTVNRWKNGKVVPRPMMRRLVFQMLEERATKELRTMKQHSTSRARKGLPSLPPSSDQPAQTTGR